MKYILQDITTGSSRKMLFRLEFLDAELVLARRSFLKIEYDSVLLINAKTVDVAFL
jgi:hypothetical protein